MSDLPSHVRGYQETKAAKDAERSADAAAAWQDIEDERRAVEERTARLKALRQARDARSA